MCTDSALHGDSYQREIEGAVGEGGHEGDSGRGTVWGMACWNGMLRRGTLMSEVFDSGLLLLRLNHAQNRLLVVWWP